MPSETESYRNERPQLADPGPLGAMSAAVLPPEARVDCTERAVLGTISTVVATERCGRIRWRGGCPTPPPQRRERRSGRWTHRPRWRSIPWKVVAWCEQTTAVPDPKIKKAASSWPMARTPSTVAGAAWTMSADLMGVAALQHRLCRAEHRCCKQVAMVVLEERRSSWCSDRGSFTNHQGVITLVSPVAGKALFADVVRCKARILASVISSAACCNVLVVACSEVVDDGDVCRMRFMCPRVGSVMFAGEDLADSLVKDKARWERRLSLRMVPISAVECPALARSRMRTEPHPYRCLTLGVATKVGLSRSGLFGICTYVPYHNTSGLPTYLPS